MEVVVGGGAQSGGHVHCTHAARCKLYALHTVPIEVLKRANGACMHVYIVWVVWVVFVLLGHWTTGLLLYVSGQAFKHERQRQRYDCDTATSEPCERGGCERSRGR